MDPVDSLFARALSDERIRSGGLALTGRVVSVAGWLIASLTVSVRSRAVAPFIALYLAIALAHLIAARLRPALKSYVWHTVLVFDVPLYFAIEYRVVGHSPHAGMAAATGLSAFMLAIMAAQLSMRTWPVLAAALLAMGMQIALFVHSGNGFMFPYALWVPGVGALLGIYLASRMSALLRTVIVEAQARVREAETKSAEVRALNDELQRQVAERSRELAEVVRRLPARVSGSLDDGEVIDGRYRVVRALGAGGMGRVYEAERLVDGRRLALKMLSGVIDRDALARFAREAEIAAQLDHPNLVAARDVGVTGAGMFLVMDLVAGSSLAEHGARFGDADWALPLLKQIVAGLSALHERGIIHRDLKPSNVLLEGGVAKLADFGIASVMPSADSDTTVSRGFEFLGTPPYMAPELTQSAATTRSDVFSLGVMAYQLLADRLPFATPPVVALTRGEPVTPPAPLRADLPPPLASLIERCLSPIAAERPAVEEISLALT